MVKILNPKYYSGELQQLHFELAEVRDEESPDSPRFVCGGHVPSQTDLAALNECRFLFQVYTDMMELKYSCLPKGMLKPTDGPVNKINLLTRKAIL